MSRLLAALALLALAGSSLHAQQEALRGFTAEASARERGLEDRLRSAGDTGLARRHGATLSLSPHVAGTPAQQETARYVLEQMAGFGLDTSRADFTVYIPYPESTVVEMVTPSPMRLNLLEPVLAEDRATQGEIWPAMIGHAASGDVTGAVVYVNYGLPDDYRVLDSLGVPVAGRIVIARYGRSFRGIKAREAERRHAAALLLYSDPEDDGYVVGDVYPQGPMRNPMSPQRGSILNTLGDPSTPNGPSLPGAPRLTPADMDLPRIPVVPIGYANAALLLEPLDGPIVPGNWQGGLPFHYHLGAGAVQVRVGLWHEPDVNAFKRITDTFGTLRGSEFPDEAVIIGGHRDAWGPGAVDNTSGVVSILEAARMLGDLARQGLRPRRTIVLATWDAEEWGLMGSTEWVESREAELTRNAVAYVNLDVSAGGRSFGAEGTSTLQGLLREIAGQVRQPYDSTTVYQAWRRQQRVSDSGEVTQGDLGGGSDFSGFYNHLGIASIGFGFGGPSGIYHSAYDSHDWMLRFGDPAFEEHVAAGTMAAMLLSRLANADLAPMDFGALATRLAAAVRGYADTVNTAALQAAVKDLARAADAWAEERDRALSRGRLAKRTLGAVNSTLRGVEPALLRPTGLRGRAWMRNLTFASDRDNGYANIALPGIAEALRDGDTARASAEVTDLANRVREAASRLDAATSRLRQR